MVTMDGAYVAGVDGCEKGWVWFKRKWRQINLAEVLWHLPERLIALAIEIPIRADGRSSSIRPSSVPTHRPAPKPAFPTRFEPGDSLDRPRTLNNPLENHSKVPSRVQAHRRH